MSVSENIQLASEDEQRLGYRMKTLLDYLCMMIQVTFSPFPFLLTPKALPLQVSNNLKYGVSLSKVFQFLDFHN